MVNCLKTGVENGLEMNIELPNGLITMIRLIRASCHNILHNRYTIKR